MNNTVKGLLVILAAGIVAIVMGLFGYITDLNDNKTFTETAEATVVSYEESEEWDSSAETMDTVYYPVVEFTAGDQTVQSKYSQSYASKEYEIGEKVTINYDPENPEDFKVAGENRGIVGAIWEIPVGIILVLIATVGLCRKMIRR